MFKVLIPATSANVGAGFDCMGIALDLYNEIIFEKSQRLEVITDKGLPEDKNNLVVATIKSLFEKTNKAMPPFKMTQINNIPVASGLGSSAACIVGGFFAANYMLGEIYTKEQLIKFCVEADGHPDNVVPAVLGGVVNSVMCENGEVAVCRTVSKNIELVCAVPDFELMTSESRAVLPANYKRNDFVYNCSRAVATFAALSNNDAELLAKVVGDRIHEPYRKPLIKGYAEIERNLKDSGAIAVYLSGAGPTIAAFADNNFKLIQPLSKGWSLYRLKIVSDGVRLISML